MVCYISYYQSPLGTMLLASEDNALVGAWFEEQRFYGLSGRFNFLKYNNFKVHDDAPALVVAREWLDGYFMGRDNGRYCLPLAPQGTAFQQLVWQLLFEIPFGETSTYGALAKKAAQHLHCTSMSSQAVGNAVGRNPLSVIIPCHRVLGCDHRLVGYAGGLERKMALLKIEGHITVLPTHSNSTNLAKVVAVSERLKSNVHIEIQ